MVVLGKDTVPDLMINLTAISLEANILRTISVEPKRENEIARLKVPKREIFDHSDFHDFYAIKSLTASDFGVKIKICLKNI